MLRKYYWLFNIIWVNSVCPSYRLPVRQSVFVSFRLFFRLWVHRSVVCLFVCPFVCPFFCPFDFLFTTLDNQQKIIDNNRKIFQPKVFSEFNKLKSFRYYSSNLELSKIRYYFCPRIIHIIMVYIFLSFSSITFVWITPSVSFYRLLNFSTWFDWTKI